MSGAIQKCRVRKFIFLFPLLATLLGACRPHQDVDQAIQPSNVFSQTRPLHPQKPDAKPLRSQIFGPYTVRCEPMGCRVTSSRLQFMVRTQDDELAIDPVYFDAEPESKFAGATYTKSPIQFSLIQNRNLSGHSARFAIGRGCPHVGFYSEFTNVFEIISVNEFIDRLSKTQTVVVAMSGIFEGDGVISIEREFPTASMVDALRAATQQQRQSPSSAPFRRPGGLYWAEPRPCSPLGVTR